jgi:hypothetical protein
MVTRLFQTELLARNLAMAYDIAPSAVLNWDEGAWRGPRVLVPVVVEALTVSAADAGRSEWAAVAVDPMQADAPRPAPFETVKNRPAGVHLHWALPDGLTQGERAAAADDVPLAASAQTSVEQPEQRNEQRTRFSLTPNRWLVIRMRAGATQTAPREAAAWVVCGALDPARRRAVPLADWREDRSNADPAVNAMGPGDPTFAVYYDNTRNLLAFHDPLAGVASGPLSYLVCGWYARLEDDPLYEPDTERDWLALIARLGWEIDASAIQRLQNESRAAQRRAYLQSADQTTASQAGEVQMSGYSSTNKSDTGADPVVSLGVGPSQFSKNARRQDAKGRAIYARQNYFSHFWPRQMLCHGALFDVAWGGRGGGFDSPGAGVPPAGSVGLAVGNTAAQALATLSAKVSGKPHMARLLDAFATGALADLSQPSGLARLESLLHGEDFSSSPGGFVVDQIEQGDLFAPAAGSESPATPRAKARPGDAVDASGQRAKAQLKVQRRFYRSDSSLSQLREAMQQPDKRPGFGAAQAPGAQPRTTETVRRPMPRWFQPRDPVLLLSQARRAYKHGEDHVIDGVLGCRITGQTIDQVSVNPWQAGADGARNSGLVDVVGSDLTTQSFRSGQIPAECGALFYEALLLDPTTVPVAQGLIVQRASRLRKGAGGQERVVSAAVAGRRYQVEQSLLYVAAADPQIDAQALAAVSNLRGTRPHPLSLQLWRRPWTPIEMDWEVAWYPSPGAERDWVLQQTDFALLGGVPTGTGGNPALVLRGRTVLTPSVARTLERQLKRFLDDEDSGERDEATPGEEVDLAKVMHDFAKLDVLGTSLGGLHDALMARQPVPGLDGAPAPDAWQPVPTATALWLMRAGHLQVRRARVIDAFGQFHDLAKSVLDAPVRAEDLVSNAGPAYLAMPPRIQEPSRLMFRLLDAGNDARDATKEHAPVCGWIVPDHLDEALEVFDALGQARGQLQPAEDGRTLEWQGVPGQPDPLGAPPRLDQPQLEGFVQGLLAHGLRDRERLESDDPPSETALSALLRMVDATLWSTDPVGRAGNEHLSLLVGHPLALVRAELRLEVQADPLAPTAQGALYTEARAELERTPLPVRLGEVLALDDGLMGYFVNDDYSRFYPIHDSLAPQAWPVGPGEGFLGSLARPPNTEGRSVRHPYIDRTPLVWIRPGQRVRLTLVMDPRGAVHATCGFLPRKKIELMREHVAPALEALAFTFRVGPVLVDPETIRMPLPSEISGGWSWVRRVNVTTWQEDPVVKASQDALLPDAPALLSEGWLKLSGSMVTTPEER